MSGVLGVLLGDNAAAGGGGSFDAATTAWASAVVTAGGTVSGTQKGFVDTLIKGLKTDSVFTKLDRMFLLAAENTQQAFIDIVNLGTATDHSTTFTANAGLHGGSGNYLDSGFAPSGGTNFLLNSASFGIYNLTNRTADAGSHTDMGVLDSTNSSYIQINAFGNSIVGALNDGATIGTSASQARGFWIISRTTSLQVDCYLNGNTTPINSTSSGAAGGRSANNIFITGLNNGGSVIQQASPDQYACVFMGAGLTSTEQQKVSNRVNAYMTSLGINVY
jgi:hypothetical protein